MFLPAFGHIPAILVCDAAESQGRLWELISAYTKQLHRLRTERVPRKGLRQSSFRRRNGLRAAQIARINKNRLMLIDLYVERCSNFFSRLLPDVLSAADGLLQLKAIQIFKRRDMLGNWIVYSSEQRHDLARDHLEACLALEDFYYKHGFIPKDFQEDSDE